MADHVAQHYKPATQRNYRQIVEHFIKPKLGSQKVRAVERQQIADLHHAMRDRRYQANRTLLVLSKMFKLAEIWGLRPDGSNPCRHAKNTAKRGATASSRRQNLRVSAQCCPTLKLRKSKHLSSLLRIACCCSPGAG
ncbi:MAG: hypothetical protein MK180_00095 [Rhodobacteraceae bacterium]|nr:hypothetical protein [Paracoccaceae bacterium]